MCEFVAILLALCSVLFGFTTSTTSFDQRQTGDLNVQIELKNIQLLALLKGGSEEYVDYDYAYDYSEMTIKPQNGTTSKPLNVIHTQSNANSSSTALPDLSTQSTIVGLLTNDTAYVNDDLSNTTIHVYNTTISEKVNATQLGNDVKGSTEDSVEGGNTENPAVLIRTTNFDMVSGNYSQNNNTTHNRTSTRKINADLSTTTPSYVLSEASEPTTLPTNYCRRGFVRNNQGKCEYKIHGPSNALRRIVKLAQKIKIGRGIKET